MITTNSTLSILCTSTGSAQYIKAQEAAAQPTSNGIGKQGDYFAVDASFYWKTSSGWIGIPCIATA